MMGFLLGTLGIPGLRMANNGSLTAVQGRLKNVLKNEAMQEKIADFYNNNKDLFAALKSSSEFSNEMYVLNGLQDKALADNNDAQFKNIEHDKIHSYIKSKLITGQFEDIAEDSEAIRKMSNEEFIEFFGYRNEDFANENAISKRKNDVVDSINKRARKVKEAYDTVDGMRDWSNDPLSNDNNGVLRDDMAHALSVMDNVAERKQSLTKMLAEMTNGKVDGSVISFTDSKGEPLEFDLESFSEMSHKGKYKKIKALLDADDKAKKGQGKLSEKQRQGFLTELNNLKGAINSYTGPVELENLSQEEQLLYLAIAPKLQELAAENPKMSIKDKQEQIIGLLKDLRHLRGRSQEFIQKFNKLAYDKFARMQRLQEIEDYAEDQMKDSAIDGFLGGRAKDLFTEYGSYAKFGIPDGENSMKYYRFTQDGDLVEDGTDNIADPKILDTILPKNITDDRLEDYKKALKAIKELKKEKDFQLENLRKEIDQKEKEIVKFLDSVTKGKSVKIGGVVKSIDDINALIKESKTTLEKLEKQRRSIENQKEALSRFMVEFYDPKTGRFDGTLSEIGKILDHLSKRHAVEMGFTDLEMVDREQREAKIDPINRSLRE